MSASTHRHRDAALVYRAWRRTARFIELLHQGFLRHGGLQSAAALTYTTLLALVPLMTVALAVFSAFPIAERVNQQVQDFLFANFVPTSGEVLQRYLQAFSDKASRLTGAGFFFLILIALALMASIDRALNAIWEVRRRRRGLSIFVVYWAVLSLGPLLIGASVLVTSYLISLPLVSEAAASETGIQLLKLTPIATSALGFTLIYVLVPNRRVALRHAALGGLLAAVLFELAKRGFGWYLTTFPTYEAIYGALATIPIFLVWIYLSWLVLLVGAEFTRTLAVFRHGGEGQDNVPLGFCDAVRVLGLVWEAHQVGRTSSIRNLAGRDAAWSAAQLDEILGYLRAHGLVLRTDDGKWAVARDLRRVTLQDLLSLPRFCLPSIGGEGWPSDQRLAEALDAAHRALDTPLGVPVVQFVATPDHPMRLTSA